MKLNYEFSIQEVADKFVAVAKNTETEPQSIARWDGCASHCESVVVNV